MPELFVTARRDSLFDIMTRVQAGQLRNRGSNLCRGKKGERESGWGREADHSIPLSVEVKKE